MSSTSKLFALTLASEIFPPTLFPKPKLGIFHHPLNLPVPLDNLKEICQSKSKFVPKVSTSDALNKPQPKSRLVDHFKR